MGIAPVIRAYAALCYGTPAPTSDSTVHKILMTSPWEKKKKKVDIDECGTTMRI